MAQNAVPTIAWVESPLQLIGAAEWADAHDTSVAVAGRLTPQISETADELLARGARFTQTEPYLGIPFGMLARHRRWLVGDGFSGQFRLAAVTLRPRSITFLDDGANAIAFAETLTGARGYRRPGIDERGLTTRVAPLALDLIRRRALAGAVDIFTAFDFGDQTQERLGELGVGTMSHAFEWTRRQAPPADLGTRRVLLGSARPVDGRLDLGVYVDWVAHEASLGPVAYLPHRRETAETLDAVAQLPGVEVVTTNLPAELVLAGATEPLDVITLVSSTATTLPLVLAGSGSVLHERDPYERTRHGAGR